MKNPIQISYEAWLSSPIVDEESKAVLSSMKEEEKEDAFYRSLSFGTAGLRGIMGPGTNRMNVYVVRQATQGLANFLAKKYGHAAVAIAYDSRNHSREFAFEAAKVLSSNGHKAYVFDELQPTPTLSFATRYLHCQAGINVTASHNPSAYNGYKVYDETGCQIGPEVADAVYAEIQATDIFKDVKCDDDSKVSLIGQDCLDAFLASDLKESLTTGPRIAKIVYTPLNGAGRKLCLKALASLGFGQVHVVKEQELPDGNFPTCPYPNPEMKEALALGVRDLEATSSDILIATDPDSDRVGMVSRDKDGIHYFTGNEVGILLFDFVSSFRKKPGVLVKTIVTSDLLAIMAKKIGYEVRDVLTGFKYIGEQIALLESQGRKEDYALGLEESCGYLTNVDVRDKDAVNAVILVAEMADALLQKGSSPYARLQEIYQEYGTYVSLTFSYALAGESGEKRIKEIMEQFRHGDLAFPRNDLVKVDDIELSISTDKDGKKTPILLPKSNVIKYYFANGDSIAVRPSGTEPKIKFYVFSSSRKAIDETKAFLDPLMK